MSGHVRGLAVTLAALLASNAAASAGLAGAYRLPDGRIYAIAEASGGLSATEFASGYAARLKARGKDRFGVHPWGAESPTGEARFERTPDGRGTALLLGDARGQRVDLPESLLVVPAPGGIRLTAKLILPASPGPHPAVVFVHGSGRQSAVHTFAFGYFFAAHGIATMVYDKRGTGGSGGKFTMDFETLAHDVVAVVRALKQRPEVDPARIGLVGYSQGGWVAPLAASLTPTAFVVVNYGMVESPSEEERQETLWRLRERGFSEVELDEADTLIRASLPILASEFQEGWTEWDRIVRAFRGRPWLRRLEGTTVGAFLSYPHWVVRWFGRAKMPPELPWSYDGRAVLESSDVPTVWLMGAEDRSAPNSGTLAFLDRLARRGRRQAAIVFPGADHGIVLYRRSADVRTATAYHPDYLSTKVKVIQALVAGRWPPPGPASLHP